jgi:hypothetical protein
VFSLGVKIKDSGKRHKAPAGTVICIWPERTLDGYDDMLDAVENDKQET